MNAHSGPISRFVARVLARHTWFPAVLVVSALAASVVLLPKVTMEGGVDALIDKTGPEEEIHQAVIRHFGNDEMVFVGYTADDLFSQRSLAAVREVGKRIKALELPGPDGVLRPAVHDVNSLATVKDLLGGEATFEVRPLVSDPVPADAAALKRIRARADRNPLLHEGMLSHDDRAAMIVVTLKDHLGDKGLVDAVYEIEKIIHSDTSSGNTYYFSGGPVIAAEVARYMQRDLGRFMPINILAMLLLLLLTLRRLGGMLLALINMIACLVVALASFPALGLHVTTVSTILVPLTLVMATATLVHILSELAQEADAHGNAGALEHTLQEILRPATMAMFTTLVGFASAAVNDIRGLRDFGIIAAVNVITTFVVTYCLTSVAARLRPWTTFMSPRGLAVSPGFRRVVKRYHELALARPWLLLGIAGVTLVIASGGLPRLREDTDLFEGFGAHTPLMQATQVIEKNFGGAFAFVVSVRGKAPGQFLEPGQLRKLEALDQFLRTDCGAKAIISPVDFVKLQYQAFNAEAPAYFRLPDSREQTAQMLLLNSDDTFEKYLDPSRSWARVVAIVPDHFTSQHQIYLARLDKYLEQNFPASEGYDAHATGGHRQAVEVFSNVSQQMVGTFSSAFLLIFGPIFLVLRSWRLGTLSIPPNLFPVIAILGIIGWCGITLSLSTVIIAAMVLGMVVDDTIHFLEHFRGGLVEHGDLSRALLETLAAKGAGVSISSLALCIGFGTAIFSEFGHVVRFGVLTSLAIAIGAVAELLVLPPLLVLTGPRLKRAFGRESARSKPEILVASTPPPVD